MRETERGDENQKSNAKKKEIGVGVYDVSLWKRGIGDKKRDIGDKEMKGETRRGIKGDRGIKGETRSNCWRFVCVVVHRMCEISVIYL